VSLFAKPEQGEQRSFSGGFFSSSNQLIPTRPPFATAGIPVTQSTALQKVALLAACNLIANMPELLPLEAFTGTGSATRQIPLPKVANDPEGQGYGVGDFGYKFLISEMLRGNGFVRVDQLDGRQMVNTVTLLNPDEITAKRDPVTGAWGFYSLGGDPMLPFGQQPKGGIIHRRAFAQPGQLLGLSVVANHARTLGLSIAAEQFGADFFADGAHPTSILTTDRPVNEDQAKTIKSRFVNAIRGSREPAVLGAGLKYQAIQVAPNESQFLDAQKYTSAEICRMIGPGVAEMLGYETGGAMTYQNVQSRSLHLLIYAIDPWLVRLEKLISDMFLPKPQYVRFNRDALLRMTATDRWTVYQMQLKNGARTINEVRDDENEAPVTWGEEPFVPGIAPSAAAAEVNNSDPEALP
jgi:HK97 family phage portal protein